jgi:hypothetical protein
LEDSDSRPYVKFIVLTHLAMPCERQGSVVGNQITDIIVLSKENATWSVNLFNVNLCVD